MAFWPLTNSDFPTDQTFHQFHDLDTELDLHRIMSGFHGAFATGVAWRQGTLTLPATWFRPPFWDLLVLQLLRPDSSSLSCLYSIFHLEYPLVLSRFLLLWSATVLFIKHFLISRTRFLYITKYISWYQEMHFLISRNNIHFFIIINKILDIKKSFLDIKKSSSWYQ